MDKAIYRLDIEVEEKDYDRMLGLLSLEAPYGWEEKSAPTGETIFRLHCEKADILENLRQLAGSAAKDAKTELTALEKQDWLGAWREFFTPVLCGSRFVVVPPWLAEEDFASRAKLVIEPKCAFGTGHHATTALCLAAISALAEKEKIKKGQNFLDIGCGSGVLSFAAHACGMNGAGIDIDQLAVDNANENRALNNAVQVEFALAGVEWAKGKRFDLVMANILAGPLVEMAPELAEAVAPGGYAILSGILDIQAQKVETAYAAQGLEKAEELADGEWRALVFAKRNSR